MPWFRLLQNRPPPIPWENNEEQRARKNAFRKYCAKCDRVLNPISGHPSCNRSRNPPIHQTVGHVAYAKSHIRFRRRHRDPRRAHEIPVRSASSSPLPFPTPRPSSPTPHETKTPPLTSNSYKGMSHIPSLPTTTNTSTTQQRTLTPQTTGFSQIHNRGGGEGGGQAMSVLLSWHEKVVEIAGLGAVVRVMSDRRIV